jgi:hypothetical protein
LPGPARSLVQAGEVDGRRLAISGASAGGFTTLCALAFHDLFAAGTSAYGIPLGLGLLAALLVIHALGYSASAWILGRFIMRAPSGWLLAFLIGWVILRVVALVPILGGLVWFAAVVFGLGALTVAIWRARTTTSRAAPAAA